MQVAVTKKLFPWETLEDNPSLQTVDAFLAGLPDGKLLAGLQEVPELGRHAAGDATGLSARPGRTKKGNPDKLPEPAGGRKEYKDGEGKVTKVIEWFGYKLHLVVDVPNEVALAYRVTAPSAGDNEVLPETLKEALENLRSEEPAAPPPDAPQPPARGPKGTQPPAPCRIETLAFDMAADDEAVHELLGLRGIKAVIENRSLWKSEFERMLPGHDGRSNVVYDEAGTLYCYDKASDPPVRHRMAYIGHEPSRGTVKYRCPAMHGQWACPSHERCNAGKKYGKTVRVKCELDLRRFPPIPRATKQFERLYKGRTAVERVNGRLKVFWGADDGNVTGPERFHAHIAVVMLVHIGLATLLARASGRKGTLGTMRLTTVAEALHGRPPASRGR